MSEQSEAVVPAEIRGQKAYLQWVNNKTNDTKQQILKDAGLKVPGWIVQSSGINDCFQQLHGFLIDPLKFVYAHKDANTGGAIPGTGITKQDYEALDGDSKKDFKEYGFCIVGVIDEANDSITPAVFEAYNFGLQRAVREANNAFGRDDGDKGIPHPAFRLKFVGDCHLDKNAKTGKPQTEGKCRLTRVKADSPDGERVLRHLASEQFKANVRACKEAVEWKIKKIIEGEPRQEA